MDRHAGSTSGLLHRFSWLGTIVIVLVFATLTFMGARWLLVEGPPSQIDVGIAFRIADFDSGNSNPDHRIFKGTA
jgi:hypothetical protein